MLTELSEYIRHNVVFDQLPTSFQGLCGSDPEKYGELVIEYNYSNQRMYSQNLVQIYITKEEKYYTQLLEHNCKNLMIFPYHLSKELSKFSRVEPAEFYKNMLERLLNQNKSYDSIPNFTAADILQLLGIGRNQYIDIVVKSRANKSWIFKKTSYRQYIQRFPNIWPACSDWWLVKVSFVTVEDITHCTSEEKAAIDDLIDNGQLSYNYFSPKVILSLFKRSLIWFDIIVKDSDHFSVPTLENFVMNRVQGDYMETTMYKIFISIDENTSVSELAALLDLDITIVKNAISLFCRLGLCCKIVGNTNTTIKVISENIDLPTTFDETSLYDHMSGLSIKMDHNHLIETQQHLNSIDDIYLADHSPCEKKGNKPKSLTSFKMESPCISSRNESKRIGIFFDSSLSAFLMMGNLSNGLKSYAVTMYEVGKLTNESMDSFINELSNMQRVNEGDAHMYYLHAINLLHTLKTLRNSSNVTSNDQDSDSLETDGIDLLSMESFCSLDSITRLKILQKRYSILISIAPLLPNIMCITTYSPYYFGPCIPEVKTPWYRIFLYSKLECGPPSLFLPKGYVMSFLPEIFNMDNELIITPYRNESCRIQINTALIVINNYLKNSALLVQSYKRHNYSNVKLIHIPFPFNINKTTDDVDSYLFKLLNDMTKKFNLNLSFGYVTMIFYDCNNENINNTQNTSSYTDQASFVDSSQNDYQDKAANVDMMMSGMVVTDVNELTSWNGKWIPFDICYGIPIFDTKMNQSICEKIKENNTFKRENLEEYSECIRAHSVEFMNYMKKNQAIRGKSPKDGNFKKFETETLPTFPILFDGQYTIQWKDPLIDNHIQDYQHH